MIQEEQLRQRLSTPDGRKIWRDKLKIHDISDNDLVDACLCISFCCWYRQRTLPYVALDKVNLFLGKAQQFQDCESKRKIINVLTRIQTAEKIKKDQLELAINHIFYCQMMNTADEIDEAIEEDYEEEEEEEFDEKVNK